LEPGGIIARTAAARSLIRQFFPFFRILFRICGRAQPLIDEAFTLARRFDWKAIQAALAKIDL
jgi:hypothetical protein